MLAAYSFTLPSVLILGGLLFLLSTVGAGLVPLLRLASVGISVFISCLLLEYIIRVLRQAQQEKNGGAALINFIAAALLSGSDEAAELWELLGGNVVSPPAMSVSTMIMLFLMLFFLLDGSYRSRRLLPVMALAIAYVIGAACPNSQLPLWAAAVAGILAVAAVLLRHGVDGAAELRWRGSQKGMAKRLALIWMLPLLAAVPALLISSWQETLGFLATGTKSGLISFGGGEAYVAIADDVFVGQAYISSGQLYETLLPLANLLPGPIMIKLLAGVGFCHGGALAGNVGAVIWMLLGTAVGVAASLTLFLPLLNLCEVNFGLPLFTRLQTWILPVICGMMATVLLSLVTSALEVSGDCLPRWESFALVGTLFLGVAFLKRLRVPDLLLVLLSSAASLLLLLCI